MTHETGTTPTKTGGVILITGAAGGLGQAVARRLSGSAEALVLLDRESAETLANELAPTTTATLVADMRDFAKLESELSRAIEMFGRIDHLVHCAAVLRMCPIEDLSPEEFLDVLNVNVVGAFVVARRIAEKSTRGGSLVMISSVGGLLSGTDSIAYGSSKHAMHGVVQGLALQYASKGIRVNAILPGTMESPLWEREVADDFRDRIKALPREFLASAQELSSLGRLPTLEQVADLCAFLVSDASAATSGQFYVVWGSPVAIA